MSGSPIMRTSLARLEAIRSDIEKTIDASRSREHWRALVRSVLEHWITEFHIDGMRQRAVLEEQIVTLQKQLNDE